MCLNSYSFALKRIIKVLSLSCFIIFTALSATAQHRQSDALAYGGGGGGDPDPNGWGLSFSGGYDGTTGDMRGTYNGAPTYSISLLRNWNGFTFNGTIGYLSYKPKQDTSAVFAGNTQVGYIKYDNFNSLEFFAGAAYNIPIADITNLYIGANIGSYDNHFKYDAVTVEGDFPANIGGETGYIAPKLGLNFIISNHFAFGIEARYNFEFGSYKSSSEDSYGYNTSNIKTYTVSGLLSYYF